jgi:hypothetical protein
VIIVMATDAPAACDREDFSRTSTCVNIKDHTYLTG